MSMAEIAYRESVRAIESQEASLAELRSRSGLVFAAAALSVSVLGTAVLEDGWGTAEWAGVVFLGCMVLALAVVTWPREWQFQSKAADIVSKWVDVDDGSTPDDLYRDLAIYLSGAWDANQEIMNKLNRTYAFAIGFAIASPIAFALALF